MEGKGGMGSDVCAVLGDSRRRRVSEEKGKETISGGMGNTGVSGCF